MFIYIYICIYIHSFSILSDDRSKASSKTVPSHSAIHSFLFQMTVESFIYIKKKYIYIYDSTVLTGLCVPLCVFMCLIYGVYKGK
jgi:hypothetical protein